MRYVIMVLASFFAAFTLMAADGQWVGLSDDD